MKKLGHQLAQELLDTQGPFLSGKALWQSLGFNSSAALRQAKSQNRLEVHVFSITNRKGLYAFTEDVAHWLRKIDGEAEMK